MKTATQLTPICNTCGFQWKRGENGEHSCSERLRAQIEELRTALSGRTVSCARCNERVKAETHLMDRPWIGVDLDGTLAHYDEWRGIEHIGPPIEEMRLRVKQWLAEGQEVRILTARVGPQRQDVPHTIAEITRHIEAWCLTHLGQVLRVTSQKDYCMVAFWDDRCVQVVPNTGRSLETELAAANAQALVLREALQPHFNEMERRCIEAELRDLHATAARNREHPRYIAAKEALSGAPPPIVSKEVYERDVAMLNQRLIERTQDMLEKFAGIEADLRKRLAEAERDAQGLATILSQVLESARPHLVDQPAMYRAWATAGFGLMAYQMKKTTNAPPAWCRLLTPETETRKLI